jgi:hypothetical protein
VGHQHRQWLKRAVEDVGTKASIERAVADVLVQWQNQLREMGVLPPNVRVTISPPKRRRLRLVEKESPPLDRPETK